MNDELNDMQIIRVGGAELTDDIKTMRRFCKELGIDAKMIISVVISHSFQRIVDGMSKEKAVEGISKWIIDNFYGDFGIEECFLTDVAQEWLLVHDASATAIAEAVVKIMFDIKQVLENGNLINDGKTHAYELVRISDSGAMVFGRYGGDN